MQGEKKGALKPEFSNFCRNKAGINFVLLIISSARHIQANLNEDEHVVQNTLYYYKNAY